MIAMGVYFVIGVSATGHLIAGVFVSGFGAGYVGWVVWGLRSGGALTVQARAFSDNELRDISGSFGRRFGGSGSGITSSGIGVVDGEPFIGVCLAETAPAPELPTEYQGLPVRVTGRGTAVARAEALHDAPLD
jgi:hypothetical protein